MAVPILPIHLPAHDMPSVAQDSSDSTSGVESGESRNGSEDGHISASRSDTTISEGDAIFLLTQSELRSTRETLMQIFSEDVLAKMMRVATEALQNNDPPVVYPEFVPQKGETAGRYYLRDADFWTCGFFPGILYLLRERAIRYPQTFPFIGHDQNSRHLTSSELRPRLASLCQTWMKPLYAMASRTDTHDLGFILQPSLRKDWELTGNERSLQALLTGADSLAQRYGPGVGAIRSWDALRQADITITSLTDDFLVIIDSMCNLDLLFYASNHLSNPVYADIAVTHARTLLKSHLRPEPAAGRADKSYRQPMYSTCHVVNFDPQTGAVKERRTAQGYKTNSTWARGQAWAILGYAQTYNWTKENEFLTAACGLAEYFLWRLETSPDCVEMINPKATSKNERIGRFVPLWDFDAPIEDATNPLRDSSAGVIAANGLLLLSQAMAALDDEVLAQRYRHAAIKIVCDTLDYSMSEEKARFVHQAANPGKVQIEDVIPGRRFDSILKNATANHNAKDHDRYSDHGLVYADYYLLEFGNQLLRMSFI